jgi:hypothetical protein
MVGALVTTLGPAADSPVTAVQQGLACALLVLGSGLLISSFVGRTGAGTVFWGLVTACLLTVTAALPSDVDTDWIRKEWRPVSVADTRQGYELGAGLAQLDLTDLPVRDGQTVPVHVQVGTGRVEVVVPEDVTVKVRIDVGLGDIRSPRASDRDTGVGGGLTEEYTLPASEGSGGDARTGKIELRIGMAAGTVEVTRVAS